MASNFIPRLTESGVRTSPWYVGSGNPFVPAGYGMPNCTCYAYGRYAEARNAWANLPTGNAKDWYSSATAFNRGTSPALGAVICWGTTGTGPGHVAVVEQINTDCSIVCSMSHYSARTDPSMPYWNLETIRPPLYDSAYLDSSYYFQGFIYNDWAPGESGGGGLPPADWQAKTLGGYSRTSNEALQNAICTYRKLYSLGWSLNAICAIYGNFEAESGYNPWRWESDSVPSYPDTPSYGYGLPQFTPSSKYISDSNAKGYFGYSPNWVGHAGNPNDGDAQLEFIHNYADYYSTSSYPLTFEEFKVSQLSAGTLARAWLYNYERPADPASTEDYRAESADYWFGILSQYNPDKVTKKKRPIFLLCGAPPLK